MVLGKRTRSQMSTQASSRAAPGWAAARAAARSTVNTTAGTKSMNYKSRSYKPKRLSGSVKTRVARLERDLVLNVDRKVSILVNETASNITASNPLVEYINSTPQGTGQTNRLGTKVNLGKGHCSMQVRWDHGNQSGAAANHNFRILVVMQKETNLQAMTLNQLFRGNTPEPHQMFDNLNQNVFQNFKILYDNMFESKLPSIAYDGTDVINSDTRQVINFGWDCQNYQAKWDEGSSGAIGDHLAGAVYLILLTTSTASGRLIIDHDTAQYFTEKKAY